MAAGRRRCWLRPADVCAASARDGITEEQARIRMAAQPADEYYIARASLVIRNDGSAAQAARGGGGTGGEDGEVEP